MSRLKSNIKIITKEFYCSKEKDVIVCVIKAYVNDDKLTTEYWCIPHHSRCEMSRIYTFVGKAKLTKGDTPNDKLGMRIAESRAKEKMFKHAYKEYTKLQAKIKELMMEVVYLKNNNIALAQREFDHVRDMIYETGD